MRKAFDCGCRRIILLDDGEEMLEVFGSVLGFYLPDSEILKFTCGLEALDEIKRKPPDLLVMDWLRPHDNGEDMLAALAERKETFPVLVASGGIATQELVQRSAAPWQRVALMQKPVSPGDLVATVVSLLVNGTPAQPVKGRKRPLTDGRKGGATSKLFDVGRRRIILLDDHEEMVEMFAVWLRQYLLESEILLFTSGLAALNEVKRQPPDILVMDWNRPHQNGEDMLAALADRKETFPVLVASGSATKEMVERAATPWQRVALLPKPFSNGTFLFGILNLMLSSAPLDLLEGRKLP